MIENGVVKVGERMMTGQRGVFAGGDMAPSERTVTVAVGHGKKAARCIDAYLTRRVFAPPRSTSSRASTGSTPGTTTDAPRDARGPCSRRCAGVATFEEVVRGLDETNALYEARRCLSCGNCFECDNCYGVCPDNAVIKPGPDGAPYAFDLDYCKGCGLCATECPCGAIEMIPEEV